MYHDYLRLMHTYTTWCKAYQAREHCVDVHGAHIHDGGIDGEGSNIRPCQPHRVDRQSLITGGHYNVSKGVLGSINA